MEQQQKRGTWVVNRSGHPLRGADKRFVMRMIRALLRKSAAHSRWMVRENIIAAGRAEEIAKEVVRVTRGDAPVSVGATRWVQRIVLDRDYFGLHVFSALVLDGQRHNELVRVDR
jgi:1,2-phenylacetyl-CoA epoxidase PaaB subunit